MAEELLSVGIDVGTTSTQLVFSRLSIGNQNGAFSVPKMAILDRKCTYKSPVFFTPLKGGNLVDGDGIRRLIASEYEKAGISRESVDTGAIIITGETSRKENAAEVLSALSDFAGDFVVATAGPDLESRLAAMGAGAVDFSAKTGKTVLHMDIGGGTSNLALIRDGKIVETGCLNVGGRLLKLNKNGEITYVSHVLDGIFDLKVGEIAEQSQVEALAETLTQALEMAAGLRPKTELLDKLWTKETYVIASQSADWRGNPVNLPERSWDLHVGQGSACKDGDDPVISFSGGVADCIEKEHFWLEFGDIGPVLGQKIRQSLLCQGEYRLGSETIRATVIGAGSHSVQLSGSTIFCRNVSLPLKNRPVVWAGERPNADEIRRRLAEQDEDAVLYLPVEDPPDYAGIRQLARAIAAAFDGKPVCAASNFDMAKALGQCLALETESPILCIDGVELTEGSYLDVGTPVGPTLPVVVKTLVLEQ